MPTAGRPRARMLCGSRDGTRLTASSRRAEFTEGRGCSAAGARGADPTARQMRAHLTTCPKRGQVPTTWTDEAGTRMPSAGTPAANAPRLALRCQLTASQRRTRFNESRGCNAVGLRRPGALDAIVPAKGSYDRP